MIRFGPFLTAPPPVHERDPKTRDLRYPDHRHVRSHRRSVQLGDGRPAATYASAMAARNSVRRTRLIGVTFGGEARIGPAECRQAWTGGGVGTPRHGPPGGRDSGHARRCGWSATLICETTVWDENVGAERRAATAACLLDGIPAGVRRYEGAVHHVMFHRGVVTAGGSGIPLDFSAATGSFPLPSGTGAIERPELGPWRRSALEPCFRSISAIALHRDSVIAETAFPQGKTLGERRRNRGRSPFRYPVSGAIAHSYCLSGGKINDFGV